jgi:hypothetical protein
VTSDGVTGFGAVISMEDKRDAPRVGTPASHLTRGNGFAKYENEIFFVAARPVVGLLVYSIVSGRPGPDAKTPGCTSIVSKWYVFVIVLPNLSTVFARYHSLSTEAAVVAKPGMISETRNWIPRVELSDP